MTTTTKGDYVPKTNSDGIEEPPSGTIVRAYIRGDVSGVRWELHRHTAGFWFTEMGVHVDWVDLIDPFEVRP